MHDHRLDRGASALGILFIVLGLGAFVWVANGSDPAALAAIAPYLGPIVIIGFGIIVLVMAVTTDPVRRSEMSAPGAGAGGTAAPSETIAMPVGSADRADIEIVFGAGRLRLGRARPGHLVDGAIGGGVEQDHAGRVHLWSETPWLEWVPGLWRDWTVGVTGELPSRLEVKAGAADVDLDCRELRLEALVIRSGASTVRVQTPSHGRSRIETENGAGSLEVIVPAGVAARVHTTALLGSREIDLGRFPRVVGGYETPGFDVAADRVDIDVRTAVGSLRIR